MASTDIQEHLNRIVQKASKHQLVFGAVFGVAFESDDTTYSCSVGSMGTDSPYYIASVNKLVISALVLRLCADERLNFEDRISKHLPEEAIKGLHVYRGKDFSNELTIRHLLSQTSGLPDYLADKQSNGSILIKELENGTDQEWPIEKVLEEVKQMPAHFVPGISARYIDTNHHLLAYLLEHVEERHIQELINEVLKELDMTSSYVFTGEPDQQFSPIYFKSNIREIPKFLSSTGCEIISTASDQLKFLKAFFGGYFYPKERLTELEQWNKIFFPFVYGIGIQRVALPRIFSPFKPVPAIIGHSGSTGSLAFYVPSKGLYITGTINQQAAPSIGFRTMFKLINKLTQG